MARNKRIVLQVRFKKVTAWHEVGPWQLIEPFTFPVRFKTQKAAIYWARRRGREYARTGRLAQLVVHGKNGQILFENTYGRDPKRYPG